MGLLEKFYEHVEKKHLFSKKDRLIIAISGGLDSVVLCELCRQAGFDFAMAHCNFQLRGEESERDEEFVRQLADRYSVTFFIKKFDTETYSLVNKISIQEAARNLRYEWFDELMKAHSTEPAIKVHLLTAHHSDDNIETVMMHFYRGTGLHGMTGIPGKTGSIRRPLLPFSKNELVNFAEVNKLEYVEDSSNASSKYTRNFFRNELIPEIEKVYPAAKQNLVDNIQRFIEIEKLYQIGVQAFRKKLCKQKGKEIHIPVKQLMEFNIRALIYEIIKDFSFSEKQIDEVLKLANSESGKYIVSPDHAYRMIRHRHWFIISPVEAETSSYIIIEKNNKRIDFALGKIEIETAERKKKFSVESSNLVANLDSRQVQFPLLLRKVKTADYFYPLGMKKKKKVSRFLIDLKLSKTEKENVWVVESDKRIIWVVGQRIDERAKITEATKEVVRLEWSQLNTNIE